jgi:ubiquitin-protein ligase
MANIKRIAKDLKEMMAPDRKREGIYVKTINDKIDRIYMMLVGPDDTPYEGCLFFFTIDPAMQFQSISAEQAHKQYPYNPPRVLFYSPYSIRCHPNLYQPHTMAEGCNAGKVCLSILGTWSGPNWVPMMSFLTIAQTILSILDNEPLRNEPGYITGHSETVKKYTEYVKYVCLRETLENVIIPIVLDSLASSDTSEEKESKESKELRFREIFREEILDLFLTRRPQYEELLKKRAEEYDNHKIVSADCYGNRSYLGKNYQYHDILKRIQF